MAEVAPVLRIRRPGRRGRSLLGPAVTRGRSGRWRAALSALRPRRHSRSRWGQRRLGYRRPGRHSRGRRRGCRGRGPASRLKLRPVFSSRPVIAVGVQPVGGVGPTAPAAVPIVLIGSIAVAVGRGRFLQLSAVAPKTPRQKTRSELSRVPARARKSAAAQGRQAVTSSRRGVVVRCTSRANRRRRRPDPRRRSSCLPRAGGARRAAHSLRARCRRSAATRGSGGTFADAEEAAAGDDRIGHLAALLVQHDVLDIVELLALGVEDGGAFDSISGDQRRTLCSEAVVAVIFGRPGCDLPKKSTSEAKGSAFAWGKTR